MIAAYLLRLYIYSVQTCPFFLSLDTSVSVPVALSNTSPSPSGAPSLDFIVSKTPRGPPGKFYRAQGALSLLNTLRTGGPSARVVSDANASDEQKVHFDRFCSRLNEGELVCFLLPILIMLSLLLIFTPVRCYGGGRSSGILLL